MLQMKLYTFGPGIEQTGAKLQQHCPKMVVLLKTVGGEWVKLATERSSVLKRRKQFALVLVLIYCALQFSHAPLTRT